MGNVGKRENELMNKSRGKWEERDFTNTTSCFGCLSCFDIRFKQTEVGVLLLVYVVSRSCSLQIHC